MRIVSDSSSNLLSFEGIDYTTVPLKIISGSKEYVDNAQLDVEKMVNEMSVSKEKFSTSCPNAYDWGKAFEGEDEIFAITITSKLSGSFAAASAAAESTVEENSEKNIYVIDSLSTGPEMQLIIEKLKELKEKGLPFKEIKEKIKAYMEKTNLIFSLQSLTNLAKNGRVSPAVAKIAGVLGIRIVGKAEEGTLKPLHKCRGEKKTLETLKETMLNLGFKGGKVRISHCLNPESANELRENILKIFPKTDIKINICTALCSFYAEKGGLLVGFEV